MSSDLVLGFIPQQGPALYAYNNARFSKNDWRGIRMLSDSMKVKDPMKVGRFGLGFKSVFHMTGNPSAIRTVLSFVNWAFVLREKNILARVVGITKMGVITHFHR